MPLCSDENKAYDNRKRFLCCLKVSLNVSPGYDVYMKSVYSTFGGSIYNGHNERTEQTPLQIEKAAYNFLNFYLLQV